MQLHKTGKARAALLQRTDMLSAQERRILILSDGRRSLEDIAALLGADARPVALRLVEQHFLAPSALAATLVHDTARNASGPSRDAMPEAVSVSSDIAPAAPPAPAAVPAATRRSLAATRMYVLDMLQLQRGPEAASARAAIQASVGHEAMLAAVLLGLQHMQHATNASYSQRVFDRVAEIIPEDALPVLQRQRAASTAAD
jgi:hypothetical protein